MRVIIYLERLYLKGKCIKKGQKQIGKIFYSLIIYLCCNSGAQIKVETVQAISTQQSANRPDVVMRNNKIRSVDENMICCRNENKNRSLCNEIGLNSRIKLQIQFIVKTLDGIYLCYRRDSRENCEEVEVLVKNTDFDAPEVKIIKKV